MTKKHYSDCAVHNEPAYPAGACDCGGYEDSSEIEALRAENVRLRDEKREVSIALKNTKAENAKLREALNGLLDLKHYKDEIGKDAAYRERQPIVWEAAHAAMGESDG